MNKSLKKQILKHAKEEFPRECCGVVCEGEKGKFSYHRITNIHDGNESFMMDPVEYTLLEDKFSIKYIVHSHPVTNAKPSEGDLRGIENSGLPWYIVNPVTEETTITEPSGYVMPLIGRRFVPGVVDCLTLIQDIYAIAGIEIPDHDRSGEWWKQGKDLYRENYERAGFYLTRGVGNPDNQDLEDWDVIFITIDSEVPNHAGVYYNGQIIHHCEGRLSAKEVYGGAWRDVTTNVLRHNERDKIIRASSRIREKL